MALRSRLLPGYWLRHPLFSLIFGLAGALLFVIIAAGTWYETSRLGDHGVAATATLLDVSLGRGGHVTAEFSTASGQKVVTDLANYDAGSLPETGGTLSVVYDPDDPALASAAASAGDYSDSWVASVIALLLGVGTVWFLANTWPMWRDNAEAWRGNPPGERAGR